MTIDSGQHYVREGSYAERNLDPAIRTMGMPQMIGRICRRFALTRAAADTLLRSAFGASALTDVGPGGTDGRGRRMYRATAAAFGTWLDQQTP